MPSSPRQLYFAGPLFNLSDLSFNVAIGRAIEQTSGGEFYCALPQSLLWPAQTPEAIRDVNLQAIRSSAGVVINLDGLDADSGAVVEFMYAISHKKPCVLIRTDLRGGDLEGLPVNLMLVGWPCTRMVHLGVFTEYRRNVPLDDRAAARIINHLIDRCASAVVREFRALISCES